MRHLASTFFRWLTLLCLCLGMVQAQAALQYGILSDNFQGQSGLPATYVASGPSYQNFPDATGLPNLKAFAASSANINTTETLSSLNFTATSGGGQQYGLCDNTTAAGKAATSCASGKGWQGRVMYALLKFPAAGSYYFTLAHDDGAEIDLSGQLTATNPRSATYSTVLGGLSSYTANDSTFVALNAAPFVVSASACYLMRGYWNNQGGVNHLRLRYGTQSSLSDQALVPSTQFLLPGVQANWDSCTNPTLTIIKTSVGDVGSFTFSGSNGYSSETITTATPGTPVSGTTFSLTNLNASTTVTETGPGTFALTGASCIDANAARSGNPATIPATLSGNTVTIAPAYVIAQAQIQCSLSNTKLGTPSISKSSNGPWIVGQSGATYTLSVRNNNSAGGSPTTGTTTVLDTLPAGITANWISPLVTGGFSCTFSGQNVTCTSSASLAPGTSTALVLPVNVVSGGGTTLVNYTSIGGGGNPSNGGVPPTPGPSCTPTAMCAQASTAILAQPTIAKAFSPASVLLSDTSTITFTLSNSNVTPLSNLNFRDTLTNMKVASTALGGTCASSGIVSNSPALATGATALNLTVPTLAASSSCTVTVVIQPTATGALPNTTSGVTSTQTPTAGAVSNTATLTVAPSADLSIVKTGPGTAVAGTTISYLLTLSNVGPRPANGASFADTMPNSLTGITATCQNASTGVSGCSAVVAANGNISGSVATFPAGGSIEVKITGTILAGATANLSNFATVTAPSGTTDPVPGNNTSATVTTSLSKTADLSITKTDNLSNVSTGQTVTYTIVVANAGPSTTTGSFKDIIFSGVTLSTFACTGTTGTANCPVSGPTTPPAGGYTYPLLNLPAGSSITFQITGTVTATSGSVVNTATITAPAAVSNAAGVLGASSSASDTDSVSADLSLSKTGAAVAQPGTLVTYTLVVSNAGPSSAGSVTLTDSLPAGTTFSAADQASGFGGTYDGTGSPRTVKWTLGNVAANTSQSVTLVLRMPAAAVVRGDPSSTPPTAGITSVSNSATVSSPNDAATGNNAASATTRLVLAELIKAVRNVTADTRDGQGARFATTGQGLPKEVLEYCVTFRNLGGIDLASFSMSDNVPANITPLTGAYGSPDSGISLLRGGTGTAGSAAVTGGTGSVLSSSSDSDGGTLSTSGGLGQGVMTVVLSTPLAAGESGRACFQGTIH